MPLDDFRGIGAARQTKLKAFGCKTAAAVAALDPKLARQTLTVVGERIIHELRGHPCIDLEAVAPTREAAS
jgi:DNA polymerase V